MQSPSPVAARAASWSRYWQRGVLHSCSSSFAGNYDGECRQFWQHTLAELPPAARILDLCTGNGALPKLVLEQLPDTADITIDAVDIAAISPPWINDLRPAQRARVRFHGATAIERLPFDASTFDLVISQFGFEYADIGAALHEVARVLRPQGRVALVVHAAESLVVAQAQAELQHLAWLRDESELARRAEALLVPMSRLAMPAGRESLAQDLRANAARHEFNVALQRLELRARTSSCPDVLFETQQALAAALQATAQSGEADRGRVMLAAWAQALADRALQLDELVRAACNQQAALALLQPLGLKSLTQEPIHFPGGELLGWGVRGQR